MVFLGTNRLSIFSNYATIPSDIWSVVKEPIAMCEFTTWHADFTDFFIKLRIFLSFANNNCFQIAV
jgi:hypothetical protein